MSSSRIIRRPIWLVPAVGLALFFQPGVLAQSVPNTLGLDITSAPNLSDQQRTRVKVYAQHWTAVMTKPGATPKEVEQARDQLLRPLQNINLSADFRYNYSELVIPGLAGGIGGGNLHTAVNVIRVISELGSDLAITTLLAHCDPRDEPVWQIRQLAATGCRRILQTGALDARRVRETAVQLRDAAIHENHNLILLHLFEAIHAADRNDLPPDERKLVRSYLVEAFTEVVKRMAANNNPEPSPLIHAVGKAVFILRNRFMEAQIDAAERNSMGSRLGPALAQLLTIIGSNWEAGQQDEATRRAYREAIGNCEALIQLIDRRLRQPNTPLQQELPLAWDSNDKEAFEKVLERWRAILKQPPYSAP